LYAAAAGQVLNTETPVLVKPRGASCARDPTCEGNFHHIPHPGILINSDQDVAIAFLSINFMEESFGDEVSPTWD